DLMLPENADEQNVIYKEEGDLIEVVKTLKASYTSILNAFHIKISEVNDEFWDILEIENRTHDFYLHELPGSANLEALSKVYFEDSFPGRDVDLNSLKSHL